MSMHFIEYCECGRVVSQCRCPSEHKTVRIRPGPCGCPPTDDSAVINARLLRRIKEMEKFEAHNAVLYEKALKQLEGLRLDRQKLRDALIRVLLWNPKSTESACHQDFNHAHRTLHEIKEQ